MATYQKQFWDRKFRGGQREVNTLQFSTDSWDFKIICRYFWRGDLKETIAFTIPAFLESKQHGQTNLKRTLENISELAGFEVATDGVDDANRT
ncbi:hypothetical protein [Rhizobium tumorigenes]|uniref:Uncharacterized protein n=1 Tax=Rhizobium tumorigenes TaxID=2041385 RepID=A0AAF1KU65_9HYPH|nr:hypothetical protein [Rhizobium tumorigenes]WFR95711.1 hypothetical protein PR017_00735 [Rhizobium tumorigenes]